MTKLPIPLSPARTAMVDATGPASNVPYCVVRICNLGKDMDSSSGGRRRIIVTHPAGEESRWGGSPRAFRWLNTPFGITHSPDLNRLLP